MTPGCGNGTLVMTLRRNHSTPRSSARTLTAVGLLRAAIGPPIRVMESGTYGAVAASMRATAAITGTEGAREMQEATERPFPYAGDLHRHAHPANQRRRDAPVRLAVAPGRTLEQFTRRRHRLAEGGMGE